MYEKHCTKDHILTTLEVSLHTAQSWGGCEARDHLVKSWQDDRKTESSKIKLIAESHKQPLTELHSHR